MLKKSEPLDYIPPHRKDLYWKVIGDAGNHIERLMRVAVPLQFLENHMPDAMLDRALRYLIAKSLTGENFINWFQTACEASHLKFQQKVTAELLIKNNAPLIAGKDFKL